MNRFAFLTEPTAEQLRRIARLYRQANWWSDADNHPDTLRKIVIGSHCFLVVERAGDIIAMGRAISDGISDAYIQDVTVSEEFRNRGIARQIIEKLIDRLQTDRISWIGLIAEPGSRSLYEKIGFNQMAGSTPMLLK